MILFVFKIITSIMKVALIKNLFNLINIFLHKIDISMNFKTLATQTNRFHNNQVNLDIKAFFNIKKFLSYI